MVTDVGTNRKTLCDFLLVINSNWHPIWYHFEVIARLLFKFWTLRLRAPFGGLRVNVYYSS